MNCDEMQMKNRWVACLIVGLSVFSASVVLDSREVTYAESVVSMSSESCLDGGEWIKTIMVGGTGMQMEAILITVLQK